MGFVNNTSLTYFWNKIKTKFVARENLPLAVSDGGTGAVTASTARANLEVNSITNATIDNIIVSNTLNNTTFSTNWGDIDGTISSQEDLSAALSNKINASDFAIIVDGDTSTAEIPVYGYAYIKNNTHGLVEGLYTNTSNDVFPTTGGTANSSVFTGASNTLNNITIRTFDIEVGNTAVSASGATNVTIDYPPDFDPTTDKIISVFLYQSWPLANWNNGAVVAIKDATNYLTGTGAGYVALTSTSAQNYNLGFRIMYT